MQLMTDGKFRHIPVVEDGRLAGIVSIGDVVKQRLAEIEAESQALREYIATA
jgi:CBS domain-containing protein